MKKIAKSLFALMTCSLLFSAGCGEAPPATPEAVRMKSVVLAVGDRLDVEVIEGEYGASGEFWVIISDDAEIKDKDGNKITKEDLKPGDVVEIIYGGQVMMSFPPQIVARSVTVTE